MAAAGAISRPVTNDRFQPRVNYVSRRQFRSGHEHASAVIAVAGMSTKGPSAARFGARQETLNVVAFVRRFRQRGTLYRDHQIADLPETVARSGADGIVQ